MKEFVGTMTSSPGPISSARSAREIASVPEDTPTESRVPQYSANSCSKPSTSAPQRERAGAATSPTTSSSSSQQFGVRLVESGDWDALESH